MKSMWIINCFFILCLMAVISGCVKDPVIPPPDLAYRGGLAFRVTNDHGIPVQGVTISISLTQEDLHNGTFLATKYTDTTGRADFGLQNEGTYFYRADFINDDISFHLEGVVQVEGGEDTTKELAL